MTDSKNDNPVKGKFPDKLFSDCGSYFTSYHRQLAEAVAGMDTARLDEAVDILATCITDGNTVYSCGNGGSCAISNHLLCDFAKGAQTDTDLKPRIVSLSSGTEIITAIANDMDYSEIFIYQLRTCAKPGDVLISISSSGNSENIVKAVRWAKDNGIKTIAMTGFDGGRSRDLADVPIHVPARNYGIVEDVHQSVMHSLAQFIRHSHVSSNNRPEDLTY